ncbi:MAG: hypothetical protein WC620_06195 [Methanoregula sp.]
MLHGSAVKDLVNVEVEHDQEGLIPEFNVLVNQLPTEFWDEFAHLIIEVAPHVRRKALEAELVECGDPFGEFIVTKK